MKYKKWILFRLTNRSVHWIWNGEYPVLVTSDADLPDYITSYAWENLNDSIQSIIWEQLFQELENNKKRTFTFNGRPYTIVARGDFQEP